jgi:hypothetical protein
VVLTSLTISAFSLVMFLIFSSILWMLCSKSSFFLFILLFFSTRGFSCTSVSLERFSCGGGQTQGRQLEGLMGCGAPAMPQRQAQIQGSLLRACTMRTTFLG